MLISSNSDDFVIDENGNVGVGVTPVNGQMQIASDYVHVGSSAGTVDLADSEGDMYVENDLEVDGDFKLGSNSTTLTKVIKATVSNSANIVVNQNNSRDIDFTVTGAEVGSTVFVSPEGGLSDMYLGIAYAYVSSADTVRVRFVNVNNSQAKQIVSGTDFYFTIIK